MAVYPIQATFSRGELSPKLHSRADLEQFRAGLKVCENLTVMRTGGIRRRPGSQFINPVKTHIKPALTMPFVGPGGQAYVLVFNDGVFRVYANGGRVGSVEVAHPYADGDLFALDYDQTNDVLDIVHPSYAPRRIRRLAHTNWVIETTTVRGGPYLPVNTTSTTLTPSATGNPIPLMTGNTAPSGIASASSTSGGFAPYRAFDRDQSSSWVNSGGGAGWLAYEFTAPRIIVGYVVQASRGITDVTQTANMRSPQSWTFDGWDGASWVTLDAQFAQQNWSDSETRYFTFSNSTAYIRYRLNISTNNGGNYTYVAGLSFTEDPTSAPAITLTASSATGVNDGAGFSAADVGRIIGLLGGNAVFRAFRIVGYTSPTAVTAKLEDAPLLAAQATTQWRLGAWGGTPGWPGKVCTFEGRKVFARTNAQPNAVWGTKSGGYGGELDFGVTVPTLADDAITFILADASEITWLSEGEVMGIGTASATRSLGRDSANLPFSAQNFRQALISTFGSEARRPVRVGKSTIFASKFGRALRELSLQDGQVLDTPDITVLSDHLYAAGVVQIAYAQEPDSIIWGCTASGDLIGQTYEKNQETAGLHRHRLGGEGAVESICAIPGADRSEVWLVVRRTIGGQTRRYIERLTPAYESRTIAQANAWHVDSGLQYTGAPVTTVTGLAHLEGLEVAIQADGARVPNAVVASGEVSLATGLAASNIIVGLPYRSRARTLPSPVSAGDGSGLGRRRKVVKAIADVLDTGELRVGRDVDSAENCVLRSTGDYLGQAVPLSTGFTTGRFDSRWSDDGEVEMIMDGPLPATIRSLTLLLEPEP